MNRHPPLAERNLGALKDCSNRDCELAFAVSAVVKARTRRLAFNVADLLYRTAMRANRTVRPQKRFHGFAGGGFVGEGPCLNIGGGHWFSPMRETIQLA